jgi:hypothetical protein
MTSVSLVAFAVKVLITKHTNNEMITLYLANLGQSENVLVTTAHINETESATEVQKPRLTIVIVSKNHRKQKVSFIESTKYEVKRFIHSTTVES